MFINDIITKRNNSKKKIDLHKEKAKDEQL